MRPSLGCREQLGNLYYTLGRWDECIQELVAVLQQRKEDKNLYAKVGVAFSKKGDNLNAVSLVREGLRYTSDKMEQATLHKNMGFSLIQLQQWDMALQEFQFALSLNYNDAESHMGTGIAKMKKTNLAGAGESLEMALKINPKLTQAQSLLKAVRESMKQSSGGPTMGRFVPSGKAQ
jgi:tetratricopeptide (TPR) repeat protein